MNNVITKSMTLFLLVFLLLNCGKRAPNDDFELQQLKSWMTGSFSSQEQSIADTNFFDIRLEMKQIWNERQDGIWLYVEQAVAWALEKPYRQRVYHLLKNEDGSFESAVYTMEDPLRFAGDWKEEFPLSRLTPDSLLERSGCAIVLNLKDGVYEGSTIEKECSSTMRGASYATSIVRIEEKFLSSWDRGFDTEDSHVWGAITGPYIFLKLEESK
jgi:CpeT protein